MSTAQAPPGRDEAASGVIPATAAAAALAGLVGGGSFSPGPGEWLGEADNGESVDQQ